MKERVQIPEVDAAVELGLSPEQVLARREGGWTNRISGSQLPHEGQIVARHVFTFFNLIFAVLAFILVLVRSSVTNYGFLGVVVLNLSIGILQEIRAKRALEKLTLVARQKVSVIRGGQVQQIPDEELVRDDIALLGAGDHICADGVVRKGRLLVNESHITGEPDAIVKTEGDELMSGSFVVAGKAALQLTRVGNDGYAAKLSAEAKRGAKVAKSPMMQDLSKLVHILGALLLPLGIAYFLSALAGPEGADQKTAAEQTVAALVSLIPQGLYLLTSVALAVSSIKLSRSRVLAQDMGCIEILARTDVLCVDKTGTITEPGLQVEEVIPLGASPELLEGVLGGLYGGEPENETARAIGELYPAGWVCKKRIPFTSERKWCGGEFDGGVFLVGAPDRLLADRQEEVETLSRPWLEKGCRVLLAASYEGPLEEQLQSQRVTPLALIVLAGRIRENAADTFLYFEKQGVTVKVISGDDPRAVSEIARRACIRGAERFVDCTGLTDEQLQTEAEQTTVFGRVSPRQKRVLVAALQKKHTVAMTGDGVNDVLAMRQADCAVAMAGGAQAAAQAAQLVLTDGDFAGMPQIVAEGRRVVGNIRRAASLFLVKNIFTLAMLLTAMVSSLSYPFQPVHLTVVMALTVGIPSFFFALEPNRERIRGDFLKTAVLTALPGGLAAFGAVALAQLAGQAWALEQVRISTACAAALAAVGLLVLVKVCRPLTAMRKGVITGCGILLVGVFLLPTKLLALDVYHGQTALILLAAVLTGGMLLWLISCAPCFFRWLRGIIRKKN